MKSPIKPSYEVIIVGSGPAGATLGYELARRGVEVLILEKERLPRYKLCAGGITVKTANLLGPDIGPVTRQAVYGVRVLYKDKSEFTRRYDRPLVYMVMRDEFDGLLVQRAEESGAVVAEGQRVCQIEEMAEGVEVKTADNTFRAEIVAGADGANGIVASGLGLTKGMQHGVAMQAEVSVPGETLVKWDSLMELDLGNVPGGYGWVFPKKDHLSIGVGGPLCQARRLKASYQRVVSSHGFENCEGSRLRSHLLPVARSGMTIQRGRVLLLGDAAGLLDPLTSEGIHNAIKSAQIAAPIISQCLQDGTIDLKGYQDAVAKEIMPELKAARSLARLFAWFPGLYFDAIEGSERLWRTSCRLLRGEESYIGLRRRLGVFQPLFDLLGR
jgi:geranylgeranyl reductase family protein